MPHDAASIESLADELSAKSRGYAGHLTHREGAFLAVMAACTPGEGVILEIGSYKGRSTTILAAAEREVRGRSSVVAVDPLTSSRLSDPTLYDGRPWRDEFFGNLDAAGVRDQVEFHEMMSHELVTSWDRAIRVLWIDGDHSYEGALADHDMFWEFVEPGGVIAFHDVMHTPGVTRVFVDRVLRQPGYGAAGVVGSIGWAQRLGPSMHDRYAGDRSRLADGLDRHAKSSAKTDAPLGSAMAKLHRWRVPHGALSAADFQALTAVEATSPASRA